MTAGGLAIGLALAFSASLALNGSYVVQHLGASAAPAVSVRRPLASLSGLLRSRLWLIGAVAGLTGWALHVAALSRAPLSLVQAFSAGGLALAVPVAARVTRSRIGPVERRGITLMVLALLALAIGSGAPAPGHVVPAAAMLAFLAVAGLLAAGLVALPETRRRGHALAAAGGLLYGIGDAATKAVTDVAHGGALAVLTSPWPALILLASVGAFFCFQRALQIGPVIAVIALMTAATNLAAILAGLTVFGEPLGRSGPATAVHALALLAVGVAAWWLAPAQARLTEPGRAARSVTIEPSPKASACSPSARSGATGMSATNARTQAMPSQRNRGSRMVPAMSSPSAPAQTQEIP